MRGIVYCCDSSRTADYHALDEAPSSPGSGIAKHACHRRATPACLAARGRMSKCLLNLRRSVAWPSRLAGGEDSLAHLHMRRRSAFLEQDKRSGSPFVSKLCHRPHLRTNRLTKGGRGIVCRETLLLMCSIYAGTGRAVQRVARRKQSLQVYGG